MEASYYWLISVTTENISVGLIKRGTPDTLVSLGPETEWSSDSPDSFLHSVDISLSAAAEKSSLDPESEPEVSAFILPPKWIGNDGKIYPDYLKILENLCRSLKLKPLGFISNDEAFIESVTKEDSFPPSFILVYLGLKEFSVSLVYLGEVKKRFHQNLDNDFVPQDLENALVTIRLDSALPPRILVFGHLTPTLIDDLKNYSWIGKKNVETFLHLPDVEAYHPEELFSLYCKTVSSQLGGGPAPSSSSSEISPEESSDFDSQEEIIPDNEVSPTDLGFSEIVESDSIVLDNSPPPEIPEPDLTPPPKKNISLPKIVLPKLKLPHISLPHFHFNPLFLFPLALSPLLLLLPYFLIRAEVTLYFNPIDISKDFNLTLDSAATSVSASTLPVLKKTFDLSFTESVPATGQKETGDKTKGEVTIFNTKDSIQNIPKSTALTTSNGKKYELLTSVQAPASTYNLGSGTITMGQVKANVIASDIGPEFDLGKDSVLSFKDNPSLIAKVNDTLSGGTRRQVSVVSLEDKNKLNLQINESLKNKITEKINTEASLAGLLSGTANTDKKRTEFNREVGEEADSLSVKVEATLSLFQIDPANKDEIIKTLLSSDPAYQQSIVSPSDFSFAFAATQNDSQKSVGKLTITGRSLPKINVDSLKKRLVGQSLANAKTIVVKESRVYNYSFNIMPSIFSFINRLPPQDDKITIIQKF